MDQRGRPKQKRIMVDDPEIFLICPVSFMVVEGKKILPHRLRPVTLCKNDRTLTAWCPGHMSRAFASDFRVMKKFMEVVNGTNGKASKRNR